MLHKQFYSEISNEHFRLLFKCISLWTNLKNRHWKIPSTTGINITAEVCKKKMIHPSEAAELYRMNPNPFYDRLTLFCLLRSWCMSYWVSKCILFALLVVLTGIAYIFMHCIMYSFFSFLNMMLSACILYIFQQQLKWKRVLCYNNNNMQFQRLFHNMKEFSLNRLTFLHLSLC